MPGMRFQSRKSSSTSTSASNTGNQQLEQQPLNVALRPLFGVGNDIKNMIEPEESTSISELLSSSSSSLSTHSMDFVDLQTKSIKQRPKRKAPTAPLPSGRFVSKPSATTHEYNKDNHNIENIDDENINKNCLSSTDVFMNKKVKIMNSDELEDNLKPRNNVPIPTPQKELKNKFHNEDNYNDIKKVIPNNIDDMLIMNNTKVNFAQNNYSNGNSNNSVFSITTPKPCQSNIVLGGKIENSTEEVEDIAHPVLNEKFADGRIHVVARCRPKIKEDDYADIDTYKKSVYADQEECKITLKRDFCQDRTFEFDNVLGENSTQKETFQIIAEDVVKSVEKGINGTIMCYGQTGGGKTYTAFGTKLGTNTAGIVPRCIQHLFRYAKVINGIEGQRAVIRVSLLQIYMENITDLLRGDCTTKYKYNPLLSKHQQKQQQNHLQIREDAQGNIFVQDLSCIEVKSPENVLSMVKQAMDGRVSGETKQNNASSRSHAVLQLHLEQSIPFSDEENKMNEDNQKNTFDNGTVLLEGEKVVKTRYSTLSIVDLAGSERVAKSQSKGQRLQEARKINKSIAALGNCISALAEAHSSNKVAKSKRHIPFRNSQLTRLLTDSLGGNTRTCLCVNVGPAMANFEETYASMLLARRAMQVRNCAEINEAHELVQEPIEVENEKEEISEPHNKLQISTLSEEDIETKEKTLLIAMSTPLASKKKSFFGDSTDSFDRIESNNNNSLQNDNSHFLIKDYKNDLELKIKIIENKEAENKDLNNINEQRKIQIENLKCEKKDLNDKILNLKGVISQLEHKLQEQKQQINIINNSNNNDNVGWEVREHELVSKFTSIIHSLQMEIAKQNVSMAKLRKSVSNGSKQ
jgi:hypothetical protein